MDDEFATCVSACLVALHQRRKRRLRRRRFWVHPIVGQRLSHGDYRHLVRELRNDEQLFKKYFRLTTDQFDDVLHMIGPRIQSQNTRWRSSIEPGQQLAICLR
jgi:hypothetical protein